MMWWVAAFALIFVVALVLLAKPPRYKPRHRLGDVRPDWLEVPYPEYPPSRFDSAVIRATIRLKNRSTQSRSDG